MPVRDLAAADLVRLARPCGRCLQLDGAILRTRFAALHASESGLQRERTGNHHAGRLLLEQRRDRRGDGVRSIDGPESAKQSCGPAGNWRAVRTCPPRAFYFYRTDQL